MGRAVNSFRTFVGDALETKEDKITLPEKDLWVAVLAQAAVDALKSTPICYRKTSKSAYINYFHYNRDQAVHFLTQGGKHFNEVCQMAGRNPIYIKERVKKLLQQKTLQDSKV